MMDWRALAFNSLWVFATALGIAVLSHAVWEAQQRSERLPLVIRQPGYQRWLYLAGMLFCLGQAGMEQESWRLGLWLVLAGACLGMLVWEGRKTR